MGTLNEDLSAIKEVEDKIIANKVARFAYTDEAYTTNDANGVTEYDVNKEQNIPTADASVLKVNETVLSRGYRAQASSVTRMLLNHFFGRMSYNLNKVNDIVSNLIATLIGHRGTANGFATLDENGRIPYSQLPESTMEYKGQWNAETNTPTLADGTGTKGDFYIVSVAGTQNLGSGNIQFSANDPIIYDGSVWARLSAGVANKIEPNYTSVALTTVTSITTKYIKLADCTWNQTGTLQVHLNGSNFEDTLVINFGGGNSLHPMLCGHYSGNGNYVLSVIAQKNSDWNLEYSIYLKINQFTTCTVYVALLKGDCTINIIESTTAPTNISEWPVSDGFFGDLTGNLTGNATNAYSGMVHVCYTNPATAAKTVSIPGFTLTQGVCIRVLFGNGNSVAYPTLNVNDTGAKEIRCARGRLDTPVNNPSDVSIKKGGGVYTWDTSDSTVLDLYYDGSYWRVIGNPIVSRYYMNDYRYNVTITGTNQSGFLY